MSKLYIKGLKPTAQLKQRRNFPVLQVQVTFPTFHQQNIL